eukprot:CAMPEP_0172764258 /NCGR_PEP_ID=MMETSP1074-20121228/176907_1 /TAXON_ID=2916 /ORGANISM="Ceratium fusus, Strain PA161109" /LENGTH=74 /DNA_ID=CAMNT_0013598985 /DNA_START=12 /DNA_END=233 /DNA_ORIENTATION=-
MMLTADHFRCVFRSAMFVHGVPFSLSKAAALAGPGAHAISTCASFPSTQCIQVHKWLSDCITSSNLLPRKGQDD